MLRAVLMDVPAIDRDAWVDRVLGLDAIPDDGPDLPRGGVPYLPCAVDTLLRMVDLADVRDTDVFVDIGAGVGRAAAVVQRLTGASVIGIEIQPALVRAAQALRARLGVERCSIIEGDAAERTDALATGTVFFLYCPFGGERLARVLGALEAVARTRPIRVACVDLPLPPLPWLELAAPPSGDLVVYRSCTPACAPEEPTSRTAT